VAGRGSQPAKLGATVVRPTGENEPRCDPQPVPFRERTRSILWTRKDLFTLERQDTRSVPSLRDRILSHSLHPAICITLNDRLARPSHALVDERP
jgi:hypothetical protein